MSIIHNLFVSFFCNRSDEQVPVYTKNNEFIQDINYGYNNHHIYLPRHMHNTSQRIPNQMLQPTANHINQLHSGRNFQSTVLTRPTYNSENPQALPNNNVFGDVAPWGNLILLLFLIIIISQVLLSKFKSCFQIILSVMILSFFVLYLIFRTTRWASLSYHLTTIPFK